MAEAQELRTVSALTASIAGVAVLTAFAAWCPPSFRKLVLFSVAYGLCVGGIAVWSASEFGLKRLSAVIMAVILTATGLGLIAARGFQQYRAEQSATATADPAQAMARSIMESAAATYPELADDLTRKRGDIQRSFGDYLALRVRPLGEWEQPWPMVFWGAEVVLAAACGACLVSRKLRSPPELTDEQT